MTNMDKSKEEIYEELAHVRRLLYIELINRNNLIKHCEMQKNTINDLTSKLEYLKKLSGVNVLHELPK